MDVIHCKDGRMRFETINQKNPYYNCFRLLPFLSSFGRCIVGETVINIGVNDVIRVITDSITSINPITMEIEMCQHEEKTSGHVQWNGIGKKFTKLE